MSIALWAAEAAQPLNGHENVGGGPRAVLWLLVGSVAVLMLAGWVSKQRR